MGGTDPEILSSLASRLARLDKQCGAEGAQAHRARRRVGSRIADISHAIVEALDPDEQVEQGPRGHSSLPQDDEPTEEQVEQAAKKLLKDAVQAPGHQPELRNLLLELKKSVRADHRRVSQDELLEAGFSAEAKEKAKALVESFEEFLEENKDEIDALQFFYSQPYTRAAALQGHQGARRGDQRAAPLLDAGEALARPTRLLEQGQGARRVSAERLLTDIVSLDPVRPAPGGRTCALSPSRSRSGSTDWMAQQENQGREFTRSRCAGWR